MNSFTKIGILGLLVVVVVGVIFLLNTKSQTQRLDMEGMSQTYYDPNTMSNSIGAIGSLILKLKGGT